VPGSGQRIGQHGSTGQAADRESQDRGLIVFSLEQTMTVQRDGYQQLRPL
jgi:hypothetical protein